MSSGKDASGTNRLMPNGRCVLARTASHVSTICWAVRYVAPIDPSAPASHTAATSAGVSPPPAIGAWMIGCWMPNLSVKNVCISVVRNVRVVWIVLWFRTTRTTRTIRTIRTIRTNRTIEYLENSAVKGDEEDAIEFACSGSRLADGDGRGVIERVTVDAAADRGKGDRSHVMLAAEVERGAVTRREERGLAVRPAPPDRTNRVNHVPRTKIESGCNAAFPGWTSHTRLYLGDRQTRFIELMSRCPMNGAVDAAASKHPLVCRVDDGVNVELRDVATNDFNHR